MTRHFPTTAAFVALSLVASTAAVISVGAANPNDHHKKQKGSSSSPSSAVRFAIGDDANTTDALLSVYDDLSLLQPAVAVASNNAEVSATSVSVKGWGMFGFPFQNKQNTQKRRRNNKQKKNTDEDAAQASTESEEEGSLNSAAERSHRRALHAQNTNATASTEEGFTKSIWFVVVADFILLSFAALFAGLTLAVMGLDTLSLEIIASSGQQPDKTYAARILPLRRQGNQLLCTLVLGNVMTNTLIAQITEEAVSGWVATALSTALITIGGEIVPQALMSAHALWIGSRSSVIINIFMFLFWPICKPVSMFLDLTIGSDPGQIYNRNELKRLMMKHSAHSKESGVDGSDLNMMVGAIELKEKTVLDVLTPIGDVFMLEANRRVNEELLQLVAEKAHSRIPIYSGTQRSNVIGVLHTKDLLLVNPEDNTRLYDLVMFYQRAFHTVPSETKLYSMLRFFQTGTSHIALVQEVQQQANGEGDPFYTMKGVVTLEDVMEELLQHEILDEHDYDDTGADGADGTALLGIHAAGVDNGSRAAAASSNLKVISRRYAARTQRRIHLSANQLTACALYLQRCLPEFKKCDPHLLATTIAHYSTVYRIRPPADAAGLSWADEANVMLYGPTSTTTSTLASQTTVIEMTTTDHSNTAAATCAGVMTLVISGRAEVAPCGRKAQPTAVSNYLNNKTNVSTAGTTTLTFPPADATVVAELPSWSLINVNGMRSGGTSTSGSNAAGGGVVGEASPQQSAESCPIDYYCRVVGESLILQMSHLQYKQIMAVMKKASAAAAAAAAAK